MGEGEGAQAYGWDTYVTEVDGTARRMLFITRTLFIIIQIIGKRKAGKNMPFLEQMRHIQHASM